MNEVELIKNVEALADKWGLTSPERQVLKVLEEVGELAKAELESDIEGIKDGVGDYLITMILWKKLSGERYVSMDVFVDHLLLPYTEVHEEFTKTEADFFLHYVVSTIVQKHNIDPWECLQNEYNKVSQREGKTVNGTFIKNKQQ